MSAGRRLRVVALTGPSGSGKTTLMCEAIRRLVAEGKRVAAIKHTHHQLNDEERGDTARFAAAGAAPVILAGETIARSSLLAAPFPYGEPRELLQYAGDVDVVLIEGFKHCDAWPRIAVDRGTTLDAILHLLSSEP